MKIKQILEELSQMQRSTVVSLTPGPAPIATGPADALAAKLLLLLYEMLPDNASSQDLHDVLDAAKWWTAYLESVRHAELRMAGSQAAQPGDEQRLLRHEARMSDADILDWIEAQMAAQIGGGPLFRIGVGVHAGQASLRDAVQAAQSLPPENADVVLATDPEPDFWRVKCLNCGWQGEEIDVLQATEAPDSERDACPNCRGFDLLPDVKDPSAFSAPVPDRARCRACVWQGTENDLVVGLSSIAFVHCPACGSDDTVTELEDATAFDGDASDAKSADDTDGAAAESGQAPAC